MIKTFLYFWKYKEMVFKNITPYPYDIEWKHYQLNCSNFISPHINCSVYSKLLQFYMPTWTKASEPPTAFCHSDSKSSLVRQREIKIKVSENDMMLHHHEDTILENTDSRTNGFAKIHSYSFACCALQYSYKRQTSRNAYGNNGWENEGNAHLVSSHYKLPLS